MRVPSETRYDSEVFNPYLGLREYQKDFCMPSPEGCRGTDHGGHQETHERGQLSIKVCSHTSDPHCLRSLVTSQPTGPADVIFTQ